MYKHMYHVFYNIHTVSFSTHQPWSKGRCNLFTCSQAFAAIHTQVKPQVAGRRCLGGWVKLRTRTLLDQGKWRGCNEWNLWKKTFGQSLRCRLLCTSLLLKSVLRVAVNYCICVGKCVHYMLHYNPVKSHITSVYQKGTCQMSASL